MAEHVPEPDAQQVGARVWGAFPSDPPAVTKVPSKGARTFRDRERESPPLMGRLRTDRLANQQEIKHLAREGIEPPTRGFSVEIGNR